MNTSATRRKTRNSREEELLAETEDAILSAPSPKQSIEHLRSHNTALVATFCIAVVWFAQIITPLYTELSAPQDDGRVHLIQVARTTQPVFHGAQNLGQFLATGHNLVSNDGPGFQSAIRRRAVLPVSAAAANAAKTCEAAKSSPADAAPPMLGPVGKAQNLGQFLATGHNLVSNDGPGFQSAIRRRAANAACGARSKTAPTDKRSFVLTCALIHTLLVGVGLALGRDTRVLTRLQDKLSTMARTCVACYGLLALSLYLAWEFDLGPVPSAVAHTPGVNTATFVLLGAASMWLWLACSMLVPHSKLGDVAATNSTLHVCIVAAGLGLTLCDASVSASLACFMVCGALGVVAEALAPARRAISWGSF